MTDIVVLVDDKGNPIGTAPKATVHTHTTPLHLAFSCYVLNSRGHILMTRRALTKKTWPGVWTNSVCGHVAPDESTLHAVYRWVPHELGITHLDNVRVVLPDFRYRAVDSSGIVEWEICPVFVATTSDHLVPEPGEIDSYEWVDPYALFQAVDATPFAFSPWMVEQLSHRALRMALAPTKGTC